MRWKFTVYGLRFSKTSFWNRINTGFLDTAVATALTACGIETEKWMAQEQVLTLQQHLPLAVLKLITDTSMSLWLGLQQHLPLAVLKRLISTVPSFKNPSAVATALTACGIETCHHFTSELSVIKLQQHLPLAVLKQSITVFLAQAGNTLQQHLPLAVLKQTFSRHKRFFIYVATALTACGIETKRRFYFHPVSLISGLQQHLPLAVLKHTNFTTNLCLIIVATALTACGMWWRVPAEEQSDDEIRTSLVPDRREGKTKVMK